MASEDSERKQAPSLEAPSLRLGRRRRRGDDTQEAAAAEEAQAVPTVPEVPGPAAREVEPTAILPVSESATVVIEPADVPPPPRQPRVRRPRTPGAPRLVRNALVASALAGVVVAATLIGGTAGSLRLCEAAGGSDTCGGPGFLLLVGILALAVLLGAVLLRWLGVTSGGTVSFLAVALVAVVTATFLLDALDSVVTIAVVALLTVLAFVLSQWVTARYIEPAG